MYAAVDLPHARRRLTLFYQWCADAPGRRGDPAREDDRRLAGRDPHLRRASLVAFGRFWCGPNRIARVAALKPRRREPWYGEEVVVGALKWLLAGALLSFGLVGYFTGLVLVPFGIALAVSAFGSHRPAWPWSIVGLGLGPVVLLSGDVASTDPPSGTVPVFWVSVALLIVGVALSAVAVRRGPQAGRR